MSDTIDNNSNGNNNSFKENDKIAGGDNDIVKERAAAAGENDKAEFNAVQAVPDEIVSAELEAETEADASETAPVAPHGEIDPQAPAPVGKLIAIRFKMMGEFYFLYDEGLELKPREKVIVRIAKGKDAAEVAMCDITPETKVTDPQLRILRRVNPGDIAQQERNIQREKEAFKICQTKIKKLELPMKLLAVKYTFDGSRITFYFKAESKVDFRKLVRELAAVFRTRIELRQIGPRDETELFGGLGVCGRRVCCNYWCCRAKPVINLDAPKTPFANIQGLPNKALGLCSRPLCCLRYEGDGETCCNKINTPAVNSKISIDEQNGVLKSINEKANQVSILIDGEDAELNISYEDFLLKLSEGKVKKI